MISKFNNNQVTSELLYPMSWDFSFRQNLKSEEIQEVSSMMELIDGVRLAETKSDVRRCSLFEYYHVIFSVIGA